MSNFIHKPTKNYKLITRKTKQDGGGYIWEIFHARGQKPSFRSPKVYETVRVCNMRARDMIKNMKEWWGEEVTLINKIYEDDNVKA